MAEKPVLTREEMKASYPNQWLLVTDCELDPATSLHKGRVLARSKDRGEIHRALTKHSGNLCIYFTGSLSRDTGVLFSWPE